MITLGLILMRPSALLWALAAGAVAAIYLRAIPPPKVAVARPDLWRAVLGDPRSSATAWRRRRAISMAIHVAVVLLLAAAAADPCLRRPRTVVFVVDNSRSMEAVANGLSRLDKARAMVEAHLQALGPGEFAAIVATAGQPVVVSAADRDLQRLAGAIKRLRPADLPSRVSEAIEVAASQAADGTRLEIHLVSDGCFAQAEKIGPAPGIVIHPVGNAAGNAAVTRLAARRYPEQPRRFQLIVETTNRSNAALAAPLHISLGGHPIHQQPCQVEPDSTAAIIIDLESEAGGPLAAALDWPDSLSADNRLETTLPTPSSGDAHVPASTPTHSAGQDACRTLSPPAWCGEPGESAAYAVAPLWPWLVAVALAVLVVEWALYHRRWTC